MGCYITMVMKKKLFFELGKEGKMQIFRAGKISGFLPFREEEPS